LNDDPASMVVIPVIALVALSLIGWGARPPSVKAFAGVMGAAFILLAVVRAALPDEWLWPNSPVARQARWAVRYLDKKPGWEQGPVILMTGSSATCFGVDPQQLENELAARGVPATVVLFAMIGETHHERRYHLQSFLRQLGPSGRRRLESAEVIFLNEVFDAYDQEPLYRFEKEAFTERTINFLNPLNAWKAWQAYRAAGDGGSPPPVQVASLLAQHALLNQLATGVFSDMKWPGGKRGRSPSFGVLPEPKAGFDFDKAARLWREAGVGGGNGRQSQGDVARKHVAEPVEHYVDRRGYYALPTIESSRAVYAASFAESVGPDLIMAGPPSREEIEPLLRKELWFDGAHPAGDGARFFTAWLAKELAPWLRGDGGDRDNEEK
jgi:hypothetical protein